MNKKVKLIVFSRDRSCQVECLIRSLKDNSTIFNDLCILYKFTNEEYKEGYDKLKKHLYSNIGKNERLYFYEETDFKSNLQELLQLNREDYSHICFMVDDQIMYQKLEHEDKILDSITDDVLCFSLRLGYNINYRHLDNTYFCLNESLVNKRDNFIIWDRREQPKDFSYFFSVDGHIYRYEDIEKLIKPLNYNNPNTFEASLHSQINFQKFKFISYEHSKMVNNPINRVNDVFPNRFGTKVNISTKELNDKFLNGEVIDYKSMNYENIDSCHVEIPVLFKKQKDWKQIFKDGKDALNDNDLYESLLDKIENDIKNKL